MQAFATEELRDRAQRHPRITTLAKQTKRRWPAKCQRAPCRFELRPWLIRADFVEVGAENQIVVRVHEAAVIKVGARHERRIACG